MTTVQVTEEAQARGKGRWSRGKLTRIEQNDWVRPIVEDIETLLDIYGVTGPEERAAYVELTKQARQRGWWVSYRDVLGKGAYVGLETEASVIRTYETLIIPGLLQVESYAREIIRAAGFTDEADVERRVEARMMRREILARDDAPRVWAIIDESAIRKIPEVAREQQIRHLIDVQTPALRVQILPDSAGMHAAMTGPFTILEFESDPATVYTENLLSALFHEDPAEIAEYGMAYDHVHAAAMSVSDSQRWLERQIT